MNDSSDSPDKIIGGNSSGTSGPEKVIGSEYSKQNNSEKVLSGDEKPERAAEPRPSQSEPEPSFESIETLISNSTGNGALKAIPADFENKNGSWSSILSDNPFDNLYLDYKQFKTISDEMVSGNYEILTKFWKEKFLSLNGVAREKIKIRYGESTINDALKKLDLAQQRIKTASGRLLYFEEREKKRRQNGIESVKELLEMAINEGSLAERSARSLVNKGIEKGLTRIEIVEYILSVLGQNNFMPRATQISADPFKNQWMTDEAYTIFKRRLIPDQEWLNEKASTLEQLGEITFRKKTESEYFLKNTNFLPPIVNKLTDSASRAAEFQRIIEEETDTEKRYLKTIYHMDPTLPFRFRGGKFNDISGLLDNACETAESFWAVVDIYTKNHLHIWLAESAPEVAKLLPEQRNLIGFLTFLYIVNRNYPFYLNNNKYTSPESLVQDAKVNQSIWIPIAQSMENGYLPIWFSGIGRSGLIPKYNADLENIIRSGLYEDKELKLAAAQTLMLAIDPTATPVIRANVSEIKQLQIEGGSTANSSIKFKLTNPGFVKVLVKLDNEIEGVTLSESTFTLNSYVNEIEKEVVLTIDSLKLIKDKLYSLNFILDSAYGTIQIPVEINVVFPKKAYAAKLFQYAVFSGLYFGGFRYLLGLFLGYSGWLVNDPYFGFSAYAIKSSPLTAFFVFALFIAGIIYFFRLVKKIEKI